MPKLDVYLMFPGNCEEALNFYTNCFGGEVVSMKRFSESPMTVADDYKDKIIHSEFKADGIFLMASDVMPNQSVETGSNMSLIVKFDSEKTLKETFEKLSEDGKVIMDLQETFWGSAFAMLSDKFGILWMLNAEKV